MLNKQASGFSGNDQQRHGGASFGVDPVGSTPGAPVVASIGMPVCGLTRSSIECNTRFCALSNRDCPAWRRNDGLAPVLNSVAQMSATA